MTHKAEAIKYCTEYLNEHQLLTIYKDVTFENYYSRWKNGNAYDIGLNAADLMIKNFNNKVSEIFSSHTQYNF